MYFKNDYLSKEYDVLSLCLLSRYTDMCNLVEENEGVNILLKQSNRGIKKDKFSAFEYGMYYIKQEEDKRKKRKKKNIADMVFYTNSK